MKKNIINRRLLLLFLLSDIFSFKDINIDVALSFVFIQQFLFYLKANSLIHTHTNMWTILDASEEN